MAKKGKGKGKGKGKKDKKGAKSKKSKTGRSSKNSAQEHNETTEEVVDGPPRSHISGESKVGDELKMPEEAAGNEGGMSIFDGFTKQEEGLAPPLPYMYSDMINLINLNMEEEQVILKVLKKDDDYKQTLNERISVIVGEIKMIRSWEEEDLATENENGNKKKKPADINKVCMRCKKPDGIMDSIKWAFVPKPRCQRCNFFVCKQCRHKQTNGLWLCSLCVRYREMMQLTGDWFPRRTCKGISGSDLVKASLRILEQNPKLRERSIVGAPPLQPMMFTKKSGKHRKRRKSSVKIQRESPQPKDLKKSSIAPGRGSTVTASPFGRKKSSFGGLNADRRTSAMTQRPSVAQSEYPKSEATSEAPTEGAATEGAATEGAATEGEGEGAVTERKSAAANPDDVAGGSQAEENKDKPVKGKGPKKKKEKKEKGKGKEKGKEKGKGKAKAKGKAKGNVNVSFATEGRRAWNNSYAEYEERTSGKTESSESSRTGTTETTDSIATSESSDYSIPIGTSAAEEERQRRRKRRGKIAIDFFERIIKPAYSNQSNKHCKSDQNEANTQQGGIISKSSSDINSWLTYVNNKRKALCKLNTDKTSKEQSLVSSPGRLSGKTHVCEYPTSVNSKVLKDNTNRGDVHGASTSNATILKNLWEPTESVKVDKFNEFTKHPRQRSTWAGKHQKEIFSKETNQICIQEMRQSETWCGTLQNYANRTHSPNKENQNSLDISKNDKGIKKQTRKHAEIADLKKSARIQAETDNSKKPVRKLKENDHSRTPKKYAEDEDFGKVDRNISKDIVKENSSLPRRYVRSSPSPKTISQKAQLSPKHRPGKINPRLPGNTEIRPSESYENNNDERNKANGKIFFPKLNQSTLLRRLRCPVPYMFEFNDSASSPAKQYDSQSMQDWNLNFPHRPNADRKKKGKKKSSKDKSGKDKSKKHKKSSGKDKSKKKGKESGKESKSGKGKKGKGSKGKKSEATAGSGSKSKKSGKISLNKSKESSSKELVLKSSKQLLDRKSGSLVPTTSSPPPPPPPSSPPPLPPPPVETENAEVQAELKRNLTRCLVCPFCRLYCAYGKEYFQ